MTHTVHLELEVEPSVQIKARELPAIEVDIETGTISTETSNIDSVFEVITNNVEIEILEDSSGLVIPGSNRVQYTAGEQVYGSRAVRLLGNRVLLATNLLDSYNVIGICTQAGSLGQSVDVITYGNYEDSSFNWIPEQPIFLHEDGFLRQSPPTQGVAVIIGVASSNISIFVRIEQPIYFINEA